jgi:hypothetical protein
MARNSDKAKKKLDLNTLITNRLVELKKGLSDVRTDIDIAKQAQAQANTRGIEIQGAIKELEKLLKQ